MTTVSNKPISTKPLKLSTTAVTSIVSVAAGEKAKTVTGIAIVSIAATATTYSVELFDGTTSTYYANAKSIAPKKGYVFRGGDIVLDPGDSIRVTAGAANYLDAFATYTLGDA